MGEHVVGTSNIFDYWRAWCACGWYVHRRTVKTALRAANTHLDAMSLARTATAGGEGADKLLA